MATADRTVLSYIVESTLGTTPNNSAKATSVLSATSAPLDGDTVTIDTKVYTFQTTLTNVDGHVLIGASRQIALANLLHAINNSGGVSGTDYAASTTAHTTVDGVTSDATTLTIRAKTAGTAGNSIATTDSTIRLAWTGATLSGGQDFHLTKVRYTGESIKYNITNTKTSEIREDRTESDLIQTGATVDGGFNFELSYDAFKDFMAAALCSTWTAGSGDNLLLQNGATRQSFTLQKYFEDANTPQYHTFTGCVVEGMSLKMAIGKIIDGSITFMGMTVATSASQIAGAVIQASSNNSPMNAVTNLQNFSIDAVPYSGCISALSIDIKNNVRALQCIGTLGAKDVKIGTLEITGDMTFYFNDGTIYTRFINGTEFAFTFDLIDHGGNKYNIAIPRCKFESGDVVAGGQNSDVMFTGKWRALFDTTTGRVIQITADPA